MQILFVLALVAVCLPMIVEGMFWCFCWCFCKVDDYFRERYMRVIMENMMRLDRIVEDADREAA